MTKTEGQLLRTNHCHISHLVVK